VSDAVIELAELYPQGASHLEGVWEVCRIVKKLTQCKLRITTTTALREPHE
jgi:hypothetical protein